MRKIGIVPLCLLLVAFGASYAFAAGHESGTASTNHHEILKYANNHDGRQISQIYSGTADGSSKAATDTFYLYGGPPNYPEGTFEGSGKAPGDVYGWSTIDLTNPSMYWHGSTIYGDASSSPADELFSDSGTGHPNKCVISHHEGRQCSRLYRIWQQLG